MKKLLTAGIIAGSAVALLGAAFTVPAFADSAPLIQVTQTPATDGTLDYTHIDLLVNGGTVWAADIASAGQVHDFASATNNSTLSASEAYTNKKIAANPGPAGPKGATGATGSTGAQGATGAQGPKGDTGATGADGAQGPAGATGPQGVSGLSGAVYEVENYENGGGGSATVACPDPSYTAISGGVEGSTVGTQTTSNFAVTSSFPGRMDWDTNTPIQGRLDGWIVLGNGNYTGDLKVWALCVPNQDIQVNTTNLDN